MIITSKIFSTKIDGNEELISVPFDFFNKTDLNGSAVFAGDRFEIKADGISIFRD